MAEEMDKTIALHGEQIRQLENRADKHDSRMDRHDEKLDQHERRNNEQFDTIRNRLPVWGTIVLSVLTGLLGIAIGVATK